MGIHCGVYVLYATMAAPDLMSDEMRDSDGWSCELGKTLVIFLEAIRGIKSLYHSAPIQESRLDAKAEDLREQQKGFG